MGVCIKHRSTDFYFVIKIEVGVRIVFDGVLYSKFYGMVLLNAQLLPLLTYRLSLYQLLLASCIFSAVFFSD